MKRHTTAESEARCETRRTTIIIEQKWLLFHQVQKIGEVEREGKVGGGKLLIPPLLLLKSIVLLHNSLIPRRWCHRCTISSILTKNRSCRNRCLLRLFRNPNNWTRSHICIIFLHTYFLPFLQCKNYDKGAEANGKIVVQLNYTGCYAQTIPDLPTSNKLYSFVTTSAI